MSDNWVKVEDKLPKEGQRVIYYFKETGISCGRYMKTESGDFFCGPAGWLTDDVTHWMPLPDAPEQ